MIDIQKEIEIEDGTYKEKALLNPDELINKACNVFEIERNELVGKSRKVPLPLIRFYLYHLLHDSGHYLTTIGKLFNRDHSTILHGLNTISDYEFTNDRTLKFIKEKLNAEI